SKDGNSLQRENVNNIAKEKYALRTKLVELGVRTKTIEEKLKAGVDPTVILQELQWMDADAEVDKLPSSLNTELENMLWTQQLEMKKLTLKVGEDHYQVKELRQRIELISKRHHELEGKALQAVTKTSGQEAASAKKKVEEYLASLKQKINHFQGEE